MRAYFDDVELTERFILSDLSRPIPGNSVDVLDVPGMDGVLIKSAKIASGKISFTLWPHWMDSSGLREAVREIAALMAVDEPRRLSFSDDGNLYYMAIPDGGMEVRELADAFAVECSFVVPSPAMYGETRSVTVPSGGSVSFAVNGTYPAKLVVEASSAVRGTSDLWGIRLDSGLYSHVKLANGNATAVKIDATSRKVSVASATKLMTIGSDWLELTPGEHTLANDYGTGACTATWVERWL